MRCTCLLLLLLPVFGQADWPHYGNDAGAMRYSSLAQINTANVGSLQPAWIFRAGKAGSEAVPVVVGGVMYVNAPDGVYALRPETGELLWKHEANPIAVRGLAYWPGSAGVHPRVFTGNGPYLLGLDVTTGKPAPGFGNEGRVDMKRGVLGDLRDGRFDLTSPPAVYGDIVITGSSNGEGTPSGGTYGDIRGWDARSGRLQWTFHTVPRPGEAGYETWPKDAWKNRSGTNAWGFLTVDVARGIVYVPLGSPTSDYYGADRVGDGLYGNSLVALDARTGKKLWHQQLVHHDLWDYDLAAPPALFDIKRDGQLIPAVAQITKMGLLFVFNRVTGESIYGIEERAVAASTVPGEVSSKTQPFPLKPPPLSRNTFQIGEMYNRSPEHAKFCKELFDENHMSIGAPYAPMPMAGNVLLFPSTLGGGNWGGVSVDPVAGLLFVNVMHVGQWGHMEAKGNEYARTSAYGPYARFWNRQTRIPCQNPPFGEMIAVELSSGDVKWRSVLGRIDALEAIGVHNTGSLNMGGSVATGGGLVFIGATNDSRFRAFESASGKLLWEAKIEASAHTSPITYLGRDGKQYVAVMASGGGGFLGGGSSNALVAYALAGVGRPPASVAAPKPLKATEVSKIAPLKLSEVEISQLAQRTCGSGCHSLEVVVRQRMSAGEWRDIIANMVARGARANAAEAGVLAEYFSQLPNNKRVEPKL